MLGCRAETAISLLTLCLSVVNDCKFLQFVSLEITKALWEGIYDMFRLTARECS